MRERHRDEPEREVEHDEKDEEAHAHQDFRDRNRREHQNLQEGRLVAVQGDARHRAEHRGHRARGQRNEKRVAGGGEHVLVVEQLVVPVERESHPLGVQPRVVE